MKKIYFELAFEINIVKRALTVAMVVGFLLNIINQGKQIITLDLTHINYVKMLLTFLVPYLVSTYSSVFSKLSFIPGQVSNIDAVLSCRSCNKSNITVAKGEIIPHCPDCGKMTEWKLLGRPTLSKALDENADRSKALFSELNPSPVIRVDSNGIIIAANPTSKIIFNVQELKDEKIDNLIPELSGISPESLINSKDISSVNTKLGEEHYNFEIRGVPENNVLQIYGSNITKIIHQRQSLNSMAMFAKMNPAPVFRINREFKIVESNPSANSMYNMSSIVGLDASEIIEFPEDFRIDEMIIGNKIINLDSNVNGKVFHFTVKGVDKLEILQVYGSDITELNEAQEKIRKQSESIKNSIIYASKIQRAVLPKREEIESIIENHFIIFKPRDIVSGDFYWINKYNKRSYIVAADCTGHGVPGAFMSMLGTAFLNEIIIEGERKSAGEILTELRNLVKTTLDQKYDKKSPSDGMDIAIVIIEDGKEQLQYAGAYNSLIKVTDSEIHEVKADNMPIGVFIKEKERFTNHIVDYKAGDMVYLFSDGYADQFGGENGKKYSKKRMREKLLSVSSSNVKDQKIELEREFENWKGDYSQVDDVLLIGLSL